VHTITNISRGPHQVKTIDKGLVTVEPQGELTASFERSYLHLLRNGRSFEVVDAGSAAVVQEPAQTGQAETGAGPVPKTLEQLQNDYSNGIEPDSKDDWIRLAEGASIEVKKSWGINRIKTELEQAS
jgi:hypothetical protein